MKTDMYALILGKIKEIMLETISAEIVFQGCPYVWTALKNVVTDSECQS